MSRKQWSWAAPLTDSTQHTRVTPQLEDRNLVTRIAEAPVAPTAQRRQLKSLHFHLLQLCNDLWSNGGSHGFVTQHYCGKNTVIVVFHVVSVVETRTGGREARLPLPSIHPEAMQQSRIQLSFLTTILLQYRYYES